MQILLACSLGVWVFLSILYLVLLYKFRNIIKDPEPKPGEPVAIRPSDTYSIFCSTRQELDEYLEMLLSSKYDGYKLTNFSRPGQMFAYEQKRKPWNIFTSFHYYFVAYLEEFQEEDDGAIYSCANRFLRSHPTGFVFIKQNPHQLSDCGGPGQRTASALLESQSGPALPVLPPAGRHLSGGSDAADRAGKRRLRNRPIPSSAEKPLEVVWLEEKGSKRRQIAAIIKRKRKRKSNLVLCIRVADSGRFVLWQKLLFCFLLTALSWGLGWGCVWALNMVALNL